MSNLLQHKLLIFIVISCLTITGCATTNYQWKNFDSNKSNDAQLNMDIGECNMIAHQSVPAVAPQGQNISQNVTVNTYGYGRRSYGVTAMQGNQQQQQLNQQQDSQRRQQKKAQQQLNNSRNQIAQSCMASKGWQQVLVEQQPTSQYVAQGYGGGNSGGSCEVNCGNAGHKSGYCQRMCATSPTAY